MTTHNLPWNPPPAVDVEALPVGKWWDAVRAVRKSYRRPWAVRAVRKA